MRERERNEIELQFGFIIGKKGNQKRFKGRIGKKLSDSVPYLRAMNQERGVQSEAVNGITGKESRRSIFGGSIEKDNLMTPKHNKTNSMKAGGSLPIQLTSTLQSPHFPLSCTK